MLASVLENMIDGIVCREAKIARNLFNRLVRYRVRKCYSSITDARMH